MPVTLEHAQRSLSNHRVACMEPERTYKSVSWQSTVRQSVTMSGWSLSGTCITHGVGEEEKRGEEEERRKGGGKERWERIEEEEERR